MDSEVVDYLVVGAGSAGAIVAARLSEDPDVSVMLLEAGPSDKSPLIHIPAAARYAFNARSLNWNYETDPEPHLGNRVIEQPRGKVLGGSSSINGMVYLRGNPLDYEGWSEAGASGWSYAEVLPYFKRLEGWVDPTDAYQGRDGPVRISAPTPVNPIAAAFLRAGEQAGYTPTDDVNGYRQEGFGRFPMNAAGGYRSNTAGAYLASARQRRNLDVRPESQVDRLVIEDGRAVAVLYRHAGRDRRVDVRREIVLSAGAFNSPKLLMLSGVGPADELRAHGIDVVQDLPGVGVQSDGPPDQHGSDGMPPAGFTGQTFEPVRPGLRRAALAVQEGRRARQQPFRMRRLYPQRCRHKVSRYPALSVPDRRQGGQQGLSQAAWLPGPTEPAKDTEPRSCAAPIR